MDFFDPNTWEQPEPFCRVYLDKACEHFAMVDEIDYAWATQWCWEFVVNSRGKKLYASRSTKINGVKIRLYLHKEIIKRAGITKPSRKHKIGDHKNGKSLDCRRDNLHWATPSMNAKNLHGVAAIAA